MKKIVFLLFFICLSKPSYSQQIDSLTFDRISKVLVDRYINSYLSNGNTERQADCIYGKNEGFTLSCISAKWDIEWVTDFNGDSIDDLIVQIMDDGLGGGGNAFGYDFNIVILDKNKNIKDTYTLFGGTKMSYALLSIDRVENGIIHATYIQNPYAYGFDNVTFDNSDQVQLEFIFEDNQILDKNYKKCPLAKMNKDIFKNNIDFRLERKQALDASFNSIQEEKLYLKDGTFYFAHISGCEDLNLYFTHTIPFKKQLESNRYDIKNTWLEHIQFLKENSRYKTVLNELYTKLSHLENSKIALQKYGGANSDFLLSNNWKANVLVSGNEAQGSSISIRLIKTLNDKQLEFWEALKRKTMDYISK